jgi:DNA polymerase III subunit gamma/tau
LTESARIFAQNDLVLKNQGTPQLGLEIAALESIELHRHARSGSMPAVSSVSPGQSARSAAPSSPPPPPLTPADYPTRAAQSTHAPRNVPARETETRHAAPEKAPRSPEEIRTASDLQEAAPAPAASHNGNLSLTAQQVTTVWENVRRRTKQKSKSGMLSAYLAYYKVVGIEGSPDNPVIVIQAEKQTHYQYVRDENRYKDLEWALEMEFGLPCQVRLVAPDQPPSLAPVSDAVSYSTGATLTPQPSAYREPPPAKPSSPTLREKPPESIPSPQDPPAVDLYAASSGAMDTMPPARTKVVRENNPVMSKETLEQKVHHDPVIQEVMRTFSAKIVDIHPK